jgi:hypothetical protein
LLTEFAWLDRTLIAEALGPRDAVEQKQAQAISNLYLRLARLERFEAEAITTGAGANKEKSHVLELGLAYLERRITPSEVPWKELLWRLRYEIDQSQDPALGKLEAEEASDDKAKWEDASWIIVEEAWGDPEPAEAWFRNRVEEISKERTAKAQEAVGSAAQRLLERGFERSTVVYLRGGERFAPRDLPRPDLRASAK